MALDRPDVKPRLDHDVYDAMTVFADIDGMKINAWCEKVLTEAILKRADDANVAHAKLTHLNFFGRRRDSAGKA
jgi:hypothetical protein